MVVRTKTVHKNVSGSCSGGVKASNLTFAPTLPPPEKKRYHLFFPPLLALLTLGQMNEVLRQRRESACRVSATGEDRNPWWEGACLTVTYHGVVCQRHPSREKMNSGWGGVWGALLVSQAHFPGSLSEPYDHVGV